MILKLLQPLRLSLETLRFHRFKFVIVKQTIGSMSIGLKSYSKQFFRLENTLNVTFSCFRIQVSAMLRD